MALELCYYRRHRSVCKAVFSKKYKILINNLYQLKGYKAAELMWINFQTNEWTKVALTSCWKSLETPVQSTDSS